MNALSLFDLTGRVALVSGGSRGLGLQMAQALVDAGAAVAIAARKPAELDEAAQTLQAGARAPVATFVADLAEPGAADRLAEAALARFGRLDVLVNSAGATWGAPTEDYPLAAWHKVIGLNLTAAFELTQAVARRAMLPQGHGRIVQMASVGGLRGWDPRLPATVAYNASKGGLINMTRALAAEWAGRGITVNAIAPGFFPTRMTRGTLDAADAVILSKVPMGRHGGEHDLKGVTLLLASDAGAYITGQVVAVDGGMTAI